MHNEVNQSFNQNRSGASVKAQTVRDPNTLIRMPELERLTGLARSTIYTRINERSPYYDEAFPKRVCLGPNAVGWRLAEVYQYLNNLQRVNP